MNADLSMLFSLAAFAVMAFCLFQVLTLRAGVPGGVVGKQWSFLTTLVVIFTAGYLVTPLFDKLPPDLIRLIVSMIFLFGAIDVLITVRLVYSVIRELAA